ncbi:MAG: porin family protein [Bacteroidota bacterium]
MKKTLVIIASIAFFANTSNAQSEGKDYRNELTLGLKAGVNSSNVYDSQGEQFNADAKLGLAVGAFVAIPLGELIGVQPEILLSQKGFQATGVILGSPYSFTRTTTYIDVPLLFAIKPVSFITIVAGPQFSYLVKQKDVFGTSTTNVLQEQEFENDDVRKNTMCATLGADINIKQLVIGTRVGWDLFKNNGDGTTTTPRYKNVWVQATLGIRF